MRTEETTEAEAFFAALDYAFDSIACSEPPPAPLPQAQLVRRQWGKQFAARVRAVWRRLLQTPADPGHSGDA